MGVASHRCAQAASFLSRSGLSAAAISSEAGWVSANAFHSNQLRRRFSHHMIQLLVEFGDP